MRGDGHGPIGYGPDLYFMLGCNVVFGPNILLSFPALKSSNFLFLVFKTITVDAQMAHRGHKKSGFFGQGPNQALILTGPGFYFDRTGLS